MATANASKRGEAEKKSLNEEVENIFYGLDPVYGCGDLTFGDGADDFVGSFVAFGTGAAGRRERTNKIVSTIAKSQILQL